MTSHIGREVALRQPAPSLVEIALEQVGLAQEGGEFGRASTAREILLQRNFRSDTIAPTQRGVPVVGGRRFRAPTRRQRQKKSRREATRGDLTA